MTGTTILKKNKNMVTRKIADETILLPIYRTSKEINCIYTLNKPASIVWDMIDGKTTVGEIKDKVLNNGFDLIKDSAYRITTVQISRKPALAGCPAVYPIFDEMVH